MGLIANKASLPHKVSHKIKISPFYKGSWGLVVKKLLKILLETERKICNKGPNKGVQVGFLSYEGSKNQTLLIQSSTDDWGPHQYNNPVVSGLDSLQLPKDRVFSYISSI